MDNPGDSMSNHERKKLILVQILQSWFLVGVSEILGYKLLIKKRSKNGKFEQKFVAKSLRSIVNCHLNGISVLNVVYMIVHNAQLESFTQINYTRLICVVWLGDDKFWLVSNFCHFNAFVSDNKKRTN
jgi:hypothetical protein